MSDGLVIGGHAKTFEVGENSSDTDTGEVFDSVKAGPKEPQDASTADSSPLLQDRKLLRPPPSYAGASPNMSKHPICIIAVGVRPFRAPSPSELRLLDEDERLKLDMRDMAEEGESQRRPVVESKGWQDMSTGENSCPSCKGVWKPENAAEDPWRDGESGNC